MVFELRAWVSDLPRLATFILVLLSHAHGQSADMKESLEKYSPKSCKYNLLPRSTGSRAYKNFMGEVHIYDVFGMPAAVKRHVLRLDIEKESFITLQAEVHRDTPTTLTVDIFRRDAVGKPGGRVLSGHNSMGAGGDDTKAFVHGVLNEKQHGEVDIVFELISVEVAASQVDARVNEDRCWPIRLDLAVVPTSRAALHWPTSCPSESRLPAPLAREVMTLPDAGVTLALPTKSDEHYSFRFGDERPWDGFGRALWSGTIEVPVRLHRFARIFVRTSFRFPSSPLQLVLELFDLKDEPDGTALVPKCAMGCMGGVPVYNGQILDHAMPTGFRYRLWLLAANQEEWTASQPDRGRHCVEFDFDYTVKYEYRLTPFEVGPTAWLCEYTRLPERIVQTAQAAISEKANENLQVVSGRTIWIRDRFGFPPEQISDMEHKIELVIDEQSIFRATTHHSDGVDVFIALTRKGETQRVCGAVRHPGPVPRQTIFCRLDPGTYTLTFFADYPLGGLHPCSDFFAQVAVRPTALNDAKQTQECLSTASDLSRLKVQRSTRLATQPNWKNMRVPIIFGEKPTTAQLWTQSIEILDGEESQNLYLRLVVHSDYVSSDLRFQVKYEGKYIADTQVTSHGYADMIGPLDSGTYTVGMYYVTGVGPADLKLCSTSMVDLRVVSQAQYVNRTAQWLCTSSRVPPPDALAPQPDEQVLLDSEYVVPNSGVHTVRVTVSEPRLIRIQASSADADFLVQLRTWPKLAVVATGENHFEVVVGKGTFSLRIKAIVRNIGSGAACGTMRLNLLLQPYSALPQCPWATSSSDASTNSAQVQASDHIGNVLLDLVPQHLTQDTKPKPPVTLWMSEGMEKSFEMVVDSTAAMRLDVVVQPPFLPLEVVVRRKRDSGKLEPPIAQAEWMESRLLLLQNDLPRGRYLVEFQMKRKYVVHEDSNLGDGALSTLCAHVTITAEVGVASKEAINSMRAELLDLPDLLAVQPFLPNLNAVGWFSSPLSPVLGTQVYHFPDSSGKAMVKLDDKAIFRVVCEPADLSNAEASVKLLKDDGTSVVAEGDSLGQLVAETDAGNYFLELTPKEKAPFLVTLGVATMSRLKEDILLMDSSKPCSSVVPKLEDGIVFAAKGWTIGPTLVRLQQSFLQKTALMKIPIQLATASILYLEAGSALPLDLIRISLQVPEGLWIGEQRGMRNSLQIELPPGKYVVFIGQPKTVGLSISRCLDFSVHISATPINPDAVAEAEAATASKQDGSRKEMTMGEQASVESAPCFSMGTVPLPLDLSDPEGGSKVFGGPLSADGRLLVRQRVSITDMHDGRKKLYLKTGRKKLLMKVGISLGGYTRLSLAAQLAFTVQPIGMPSILEPVESWSQASGWERVFLLDATSSGFWLAFHHAHRERGESACLHFGLELEIHPYEDMSKMFSCRSENANAQPQDIFPDSFNVEQTFTARTTFRYTKGLTWLQQVQQGFLTTTSFTISVRSFVSAEVAYNFFLSHAEMDIIRDRDSQNQIAAAETEVKHDTDHPLNVRQVIGRILEPGDYKLRVADDHFAGQLDGTDSACFPFSFEFRIVPEKASPAIVSVLPHPSVPIPRGVDLVLTVRFSEPPEGSVDDVVKAISLDGVQAVTAASMNAVSSQYGQKTARVQAETAEGHLLWVITFSAQAMAGMGDKAKLTLMPLRSNVSKRMFKFNPPTFTLVQVPKGIPWSGSGQSSSSSGDNSLPGTIAGNQPVPEASSAAVGESVPEGSSSPGSGAAPVLESPAQSSGGSSASATPSTGAATPEKTATQDQAMVSFKAGDGGLGEVKLETSAARSSVAASTEDSSKPSNNVVSEATVTPPAPTETPAPVASRAGAQKSEDTSIGTPKAETGSVNLESRASSPQRSEPTRSRPSTVGDVGVPKAEGAGTARSSSVGDVGMPKAESVGTARSSSVGDVGMPKAESTGTVSASNEWSNWRRKDQDDDSVGPTVHEWKPEDSRPPVATASSVTMEDDKTECPEGTKLNGMTGICDSSSVSESSSFWSESITASMPSGYGTVLAACTASLVGLAVMTNCLPQMKVLFAKFGSRSSSQQTAQGARFKDIGARRAEEERGLMSGMGDDDDDML